MLIPLIRAAVRRPTFPPEGKVCTALQTTICKLDHETLMLFRIAEIAPFSSRDTWAWEIPREPATSI